MIPNIINNIPKFSSFLIKQERTIFEANVRITSTGTNYIETSSFMICEELIGNIVCYVKALEVVKPETNFRVKSYIWNNRTAPIYAGRFRVLRKIGINTKIWGGGDVFRYINAGGRSEVGPFSIGSYKNGTRKDIFLKVTFEGETCIWKQELFVCDDLNQSGFSEPFLVCCNCVLNETTQLIPSTISFEPTISSVDLGYAGSTPGLLFPFALLTLVLIVLFLRKIKIREI